MAVRTGLQPRRRRPSELGDLGKASPAALEAARKRREVEQKKRDIEALRGVVDRGLRRGDAVMQKEFGSPQTPAERLRIKEAVSQAGSGSDVGVKFKKRKKPLVPHLDVD